VKQIICPVGDHDHDHIAYSLLKVIKLMTDETHQCVDQKSICFNSVNNFLLDCSKTCTIGTLNAACDACTCSHHLLTGRILTEDDAPLSDVNISLAETPYNVLAQTNVSGYFSALGVCTGQQGLLVTKAGFVPVTQNATVLTQTTASITLKLEIAGKI